MRRNVFVLKSGAARPGGLEKMSARLAQAFEKKGCDVTLVTTGNANFSSPFHTLSHTLKSKMSFLKALEFDRFCQEMVQKARPDLIFGLDRNRNQTHLRAGNGVHAAYLAQRARVEPLFKRLTFALNPLHRTLLNLEKTAFENPELRCLFTNSSMVKEEILHHYKVDPRKIFVVHNGVEWNESKSAFLNWKNEKASFVSELGLDPSDFHLLFIGHNFKRKGLDKLLHGLAALSERSFHLSVVGEDKHREQFAALTRDLGLESRVSFFGARSDISRFYQLADVLVIPSLYDPFANVTVEALAMGLFVLSSKTNGGHEVLTKETGTLIESLEDRDAIAAALMQALKHRKSEESAKQIRASVQHLDFSHQLNLIVDRCLL